jgi:hypothetical protein
MTHATVTIQITSESKPSTLSWMGEVAAFAQILEHTGTLKVVQNQVRFARARARSLRSHRFCRGAHWLHPCLPNRPCWLFTNGSLHLPSHLWPCLGEIVCPIARRFLVFPDALDPASVEGLRSLFQKDLLARNPFPSPGGLFDRMGEQWLVVDVDGTRQAARQRALPQLESLPAPHRRFDQVCAPGYTGRKRGEAVRTRTVILQAHTHQFLGTFGGQATEIIVGSCCVPPR